MNKDLPYESLHNHTTISDGLMNHEELLGAAKRHGFGIVAFTEHDAMPSKERLEALKRYQGPVRWFIGCELSSGLPNELGGGAANMFHIIGLFTDPFNKNLLDHCQKMLSARTERMSKIVSNLRGLGFKITADDCLKESGGESVGRPHIVKALQKYVENSEIQERIFNKLKLKAQKDKEMAKQLEWVLERGEHNYPYSLYLDKEAYIPDVYVDYLYWRDMDSTVKLIRDAGGIALIAHWPTIENKIDEDLLRNILESKRLDGIEIMSGFINESFDRKMAEIGTDVGCLITVGVDAHTEENLEDFVLDKERASKSIGITKDLLGKVEPSLEWSNWNQ